jgi:Leucine-rich repeat (LRR) protein
MERADPRGELIVAQCRHDEVRARELLREHGARWRAELGLQPTEGVFVRGFPDKLELTGARWLELADTLSAQLPLSALRLGELTSAEPALVALRRLPSLTSLDLRGNELGDEGAYALASRPELGRLHALDLSDNRLSAGAVLAVLEASRDLVQLGLAGNPFYPDPEQTQALLASPVLGQLHTLDWSRCQAQISRFLELLEASALGGLRSLALRGSLPAVYVYSLVHSGLTQLTELDLGDNELFPRELRALTGSSAFSRLRSLSLDHNPRLEDEGAQVLVAWPGLVRLRSLSLDRTGIRSAGIRALCRVPYEELVWLDLSRLCASDEDIEALVASPSMQNLRSLALRGNFLGPRAAQALAKLEKLTELDLAGTHPSIDSTSQRVT